MGKRNDIVIYQSEDGLVRMEALKTAIGECLQKVDLNKKSRTLSTCFSMSQTQKGFCSLSLPFRICRLVKYKLCSK